MQFNSSIWRTLVVVASLVSLLVQPYTVAFGQATGTESTLHPIATPLSNFTSAYEPDVVLATVDPLADSAEIKEKLQSLGATLIADHNLDFVRLLKIQTAKGKFETTLEAIGKTNPFQAAQPNWRSVWCSTGEAPAGALVDDPQFPNQWYLKQLHIPPTWNSTAIPQMNYIAILDSGVAWGGDLGGKVYPGFSTVLGVKPNYDEDGHGTQMALLAGAATCNAKGIAGANPWGCIYPIKIGNSHGTDDEHIILGLSHAIEMGIKISLIGAAPPADGWTLLNHPLVVGMLTVYHEYGGVAIAPAGNNGAVLKAAGTDRRLILVAASDELGKPTTFSNNGDAVWLAGPGVNILSCDKSGAPVVIRPSTSAAAALIAGAASLIYSYYPYASADSVVNLLCQTAAGHTSKNWNRFPGLGYGIPDLQNAFKSNGLQLKSDSQIPASHFALANPNPNAGKWKNKTTTQTGTTMQSTTSTQTSTTSQSNTASQTTKNYATTPSPQTSTPNTSTTTANPGNLNAPTTSNKSAPVNNAGSSGGGGNVSNKSAPVDNVSSGGGGAVSNKSAPVNNSGSGSSGGGGNVSNKSAPVDNVGGSGGGNVSNKSAPVDNVGGSGGGNVSNKSAPVDNVGGSGGGNVSNKSAPVDNVGSSGGGNVSNKSAPVDNHVGNSANVSNKSAPVDNHVGNSANVSNKSAPVDNVGNSANVSNKSAPVDNHVGNSANVSNKSAPVDNHVGNSANVSNKSAPVDNHPSSSSGGNVSNKSAPVDNVGSSGGSVSNKSAPVDHAGGSGGGNVSNKSAPVNNYVGGSNVSNKSAPVDNNSAQKSNKSAPVN